MKAKNKGGAPKKYAKRVTIQHALESETLELIDKKADMNTTRTDLINKYIRKGLGLATILIMVTLASCTKTSTEVEMITEDFGTYSAAVYECATVEAVKLYGDTTFKHVNTKYADIYNRGDNPPQDSVWYEVPNERLVYRYSRTCKIKN